MACKVAMAACRERKLLQSIYDAQSTVLQVNWVAGLWGGDGRKTRYVAWGRRGYIDSSSILCLHVGTREKERRQSLAKGVCSCPLLTVFLNMVQD